MKYWYVHMPDFFFFSHIGNLLEIKRNLKECTNNISKKGPKKKKSVPQIVAQASLLQKSDASNKDKKRKHQDDQVEAEPKTESIHCSAPAGANENRRPERPHVRQDEEEDDKRNKET